MGRKLKTGKQRKDRFYHLAKDVGYRSRAAFKLIQLNRKFEFLQTSRVLVDLCAAPGGWLQVAQANMPVSSLIVGVDLVPIKTISNVITLQEDITSSKCRQSLKKHLTTWKADVVLHDGAPNVGKSWDHDAFAQAQLTLHALKLACELLVKGGWFVTKVFRSKDYNALLWVFKKLFKKVHATKPQASRNESAEIFVVCQHYTAPDKIDPKFLDPVHVFQDVEPENKQRLNLFRPDSKQPKAKAEGYPEGKTSMSSKVSSSEFIYGNNHLELLANCTEIDFDDEEISKHLLTNSEIIECCKDIKVLGKGELKNLLAWKRKLKSALGKLGLQKYHLKFGSTEQEAPEGDEEAASEEEKETLLEEEVSDSEKFERILQQEEKRKKKKILKNKRKLQAKTDLKMVIKNDEPIAQEDDELFKLSQLRKKKDLEKMDTAEDDSVLINSSEMTEDIEEPNRKKKFALFDKGSKNINNAYDSEKAASSESSDSENEHFDGSENEDDDNLEYEDDDDEGNNPLLATLDSKASKLRRAKMWFDKDTFADVENDSEEELEMSFADAQRKQGKQSDIVPVNGEADVTKAATEQENSDSSSSEEEEPQVQSRKRKKKIRLDPQGLALGTLMIKSNKSKRDILDSAYNRYSYNDENLPDWFTQSEEKYNRPQLPVSAEMVQEYKARLREINARPIKKVAEAKARKKKKEMRKMDKARKRAEAITDNEDMSAREKANHIKNIYKKVMADSKDNHVTYVFPRKGVGKKVHRPPGVKGKFKVVDKRMKKDNRKMKMANKQKKTVSKKKKKRK